MAGLDSTPPLQGLGYTVLEVEHDYVGIHVLERWARWNPR